MKNELRRPEPGQFHLRNINLDLTERVPSLSPFLTLSPPLSLSLLSIRLIREARSQKGRRRSRSPTTEKHASVSRTALTWLDLAGINMRPRTVRDEQQQQQQDQRQQERRQHEDHRDPNDAPQGHPPLGPGASWTGELCSPAAKGPQALIPSSWRGPGESKQSINPDTVRGIEREKERKRRAWVTFRRRLRAACNGLRPRDL